MRSVAKSRAVWTSMATGATTSWWALPEAERTASHLAGPTSSRAAMVRSSRPSRGNGRGTCSAPATRFGAEPNGGSWPSAPRTPDRASAGRTYVYRWESGGPELAFTIESDETGVALGGMFVSFPGDVDGDGVSEVYASDWQNAALGPSTGRIYVHSGATGERLFTLTGEAPGIGFGTCTADVGDVTGDGRADLLVGAWQDPAGAAGGGKCWLYSGADLEVLETYTCKAPGETFGFDTTGVGDVDGDGGIDFLVTGGYSQAAGNRSGRAFVIAGPRVRPSPPGRKD